MSGADDQSRVRAFISYRSGDAEDVAVTLARELKADLGLDEVYFAPTDNSVLEDWVAAIGEHLRESQLVVALVGAAWLGCPADGSHRRCVHDQSDWVRREVQYALEHTRVLPVLVDLDRLPVEELPPELTDLGRVHGVTLNRRATYEPVYQAILTACWIAFQDDQADTLLVVADDTDVGQAALDRLVDELREADLLSTRTLTQTVTNPGGLRAIPVADAARRWPGIILLATEPSPTMAARFRAVAESRSGERVALVTAGGALALAGSRLAAGAKGATTGDVSLVNDSIANIDVQGHASPKHLVESMRGTWWRRLSGLAKVGLAAVSAGIVSLALVVILDAEPIELAGAWVVSDFQFESNVPETTSNVSLEGGQMVFVPTPDCTGPPCVLTVVDGPPLVVGMVMEPVDDGTQYVGEGANVTKRCGDEPIPQELTEGRLTARRAEGDTLEFVIQSSLVKPFGSCEPWTSVYTATARRQS